MPPVSGSLLYTMPIQFEPNTGQADDSVRFLSRGPGYTLFLAPTQAVLSLRAAGDPGQAVADSAVSGTASRPRHRSSHDTELTQAELQMTLLGANTKPDIEGLDALPGTVSYFVGNDPNQWRSAIPTFAQVKYHQVYAGVDLIYYGTQ